MIASRLVTSGVSAVLLLALAWGLVDAQAPLTDSDYEATIEALSTEVADLKQQLIEQPATAAPSPTPASSDSMDLVVRDVTLVTDEGPVTFDVQLISYSESDTIEDYVDHRARGVFKVIYLEIMNTGRFANHFPFGSLTGYGYAMASGSDGLWDGLAVRDSKERRYSALRDPMRALESQDDALDDPFTDLQPGLTYRFALVFDVPSDVEGLVLMVGSETIYETIPLLE